MTTTSARPLVAAASSVLLAASLLSCHERPHSSARGLASSEATVTNSFTQIWALIHDHSADLNRFPESLSAVPTLSSNLHLFVCPGTGTQPGPTATIEEWSDYIYIGGVWDGVPDCAVLISPPENHDGKSGYVVCVDGRIARLPASKVRLLIREPWLLDTNASVNNIAYLKEELSIHIPKRFRNHYR
jgi:hypothetical protein